MTMTEETLDFLARAGVQSGRIEAMRNTGIDIDTIRHPDAERKAKGDDPCYLCGKATDGSRFIHLITSGHLVPADETVGDNEDQGWFPIGPECAKKLPAGYVEVEVEL